VLRLEVLHEGVANLWIVKEDVEAKKSAKATLSALEPETAVGAPQNIVRSSAVSHPTNRAVSPEYVCVCV